MTSLIHSEMAVTSAVADITWWTSPGSLREFCTANWATILRCAVPSLASFPGLSWEWGYTLFWYDSCMRPCNTVRCWLLSACAYNSWQHRNMCLTADVHLTKNSCLINGCENSGRYFHCFRYMTRSTWQFHGCFGTSSGTEGPSLVQAFRCSSYYLTHFAWHILLKVQSSFIKHMHLTCDG